MVFEDYGEKVILKHNYNRYRGDYRLKGIGITEYSVLQMITVPFFITHYLIKNLYKKASQFFCWKAMKDNYSDKHLSKESII
jgi:hypothetical protein